MKINQYIIRTVSGKGMPNQWEKIGFLTKQDIETLNDIGYGSNKQFTRKEYLNQKYKGKYAFDINQIGFDNGDFCEVFNVVVVKEEQ